MEPAITFPTLMTLADASTCNESLWRSTKGAIGSSFAFSENDCVTRAASRLAFSRPLSIPWRPISDTLTISVSSAVFSQEL